MLKPCQNTSDVIMLKYCQNTSIFRNCPTRTRTTSFLRPLRFVTRGQKEDFWASENSSGGGGPFPGRVWKYATQPRNIYKVLPTKWKTSWVKKAGYYLRDSSRRCNQMVQSDFDWMFASGHNTSKTKAWNGRNIPLVWCLLRHPTWEISHLLKKPSPFIEILRQSM